MPEDEDKRTVHPYNEAGRKLKAAIVSSLMRDSGVDRSLKRTPEIVDDFWCDEAERLMRLLQDQVVKGLLGQDPPADIQ